MLTLDPKTNSYVESGRAYARVTSVLQEAGLIDSRWFNERATTRGTYVHQASVLLDEDNLDESQLDPELKGYLEGYKKFRSQVPLVYTAIEKSLFDPILGYAGTPDRVTIDSVIDLKTGDPMPWHGPQIAAYTMLAFRNVATIKRFGLYLNTDGTYHYIRYKDFSDFDIFRACLSLHNFKWRNA